MVGHVSRAATAVGLALVSACATAPGGSEVAGQMRPLVNSSGAVIGQVVSAEGTSNLVLRIDAGSLPPGAHGIHLHAVGRCDGPKFESAGPHWNPGGRMHGRDNPQGAHVGDLPNLTANSAGRASVELNVTRATAAGIAPVADADGTALVIHAKPDDYRTDPSGASGDRIACAVLAAPAG